MHSFQYLDHRVARPRPNHILRTVVDCRTAAAQVMAAQDWHERGLAMAAHHRLLQEAGLESPPFAARLRWIIGEAFVRVGQRLQREGRPDALAETAGGSGAW